MNRGVWGILIFLLMLLSPAMAQQNGHRLTDAQRRAQQEFIRKDTLPVTLTTLPNTVNTRFSEFSARLFEDSSFYFTSMRADAEEDYDRLFETSWYCYLYQSRLLPDGQYAAAVPFPNAINSHKTFNSNFCLNDDKSELIYSRCKRDENSELHCELWKSSFEKGAWTKPVRLPEVINEAGSSSLQPFLVTYPNYQILYFVSNRKNGIGGFDIWYSVYKDNRFEYPVNVGSVINTEGNEVTPFYDKDNGILYFSSDEHLGIGDYDIFYVPGSMSHWGEVSNMGVPFNSNYNDFYFTLNGNGKSGYLASNRPQKDAALEDTCCTDIYHFEWQLQDSVAPEPIDTPTWQEKIASVLPITLYFQNDQPNPRSLSDTTDTDYYMLYKQYLADHNLYIKESGRGLSQDSSKAIQQEVLEFMRDSVVSSYDRLMQLTEYLHQALLHGDTVTLTINGYASPLHNSDYNRHLSSRRIASLINWLRVAEDGFFVPYLDRQKPGLVLRMNPQGAVQHTFATEDTRETVYGLQAAKDRKIVISN